MYPFPPPSFETLFDSLGLGSSASRLSSDWESTRLKSELSPVQIREAASSYWLVDDRQGQRCPAIPILLVRFQPVTGRTRSRPAFCNSRYGSGEPSSYGTRGRRDFNDYYRTQYVVKIPRTARTLRHETGAVHHSPANDASSPHSSAKVRTVRFFPSLLSCVSR